MDVNHPRSDGNLRLVEAEQERNRWAATARSGRKCGQNSHVAVRCLTRYFPSTCAPGVRQRASATEAKNAANLV
jgi:hypothetical protein